MAKATKVTMHDIFDQMAAFEATVRKSSHPNKKETLKFIGGVKAAWQAHCELLTASDDCDCDQFCHCA
jgi:hypothetical protein